MNENFSIIVAPMLSDTSILVIYRGNGAEIIVKIDNQTKTLSSSHKITTEEINFIKENYL